ncbi:MAG: putative RNA uridine N3 methyltransferase [Nitrososphaerales archaeon]
MTNTELWVAIPDSTLMECVDLKEKTEKAGYIARACAIHRVTRIYIYHDRGERRREDQRLLSILLQYVEAPQYLRKHLFPKIPELAYAGLMPPLRTPSHLVKTDLSEVKAGDIREGYCYRRSGTYYVDVGLPKPAHLLHKENVSIGRVSVKIEAVEPELTCSIIDRSEIKGYWGFTVKQTEDLSKLVRSLKPVLVIATSRLGQPIAEKWQLLQSMLHTSERCLVLFGSPRRGLHEILKNEGTTIQNVANATLNFVPDQGTATIRTEEALYLVLGLINFLLHIPIS